MITKSSFVHAAARLLHWMMKMTTEWLFEGNPVTEPPEGSVGFVYRITRLDTGRKYIGKKLLTFRRTKQVKGVKKKMTVE
jgi:hypothetical protein